jgi:phosphoesterase RecJ-like protein
VLDLLSRWEGAVDETAAGALYVAVSTDTGCFAFGNTTAQTLRAASELALAGAPIGRINKKLFREKTRARAKLEGSVFSGLEFHCGGAAAIATITRQMLRLAGATEDDLDDIASLPGAIAGVRVGVTVRELPGAEGCKVSVRSGSGVDANALCARFGGGGHAMAAGFTAREGVERIKAKLIGALGDALGTV